MIRPDVTVTTDNVPDVAYFVLACLVAPFLVIIVVAMVKGYNIWIYRPGDKKKGEEDT